MFHVLICLRAVFMLYFFIFKIPVSCNCTFFFTLYAYAWSFAVTAVCCRPATDSCPSNGSELGKFLLVGQLADLSLVLTARWLRIFSFSTALMCFQVLKDGMQHVGKLICSNLGARMDSEPKSWRILGWHIWP